MKTVYINNSRQLYSIWPGYDQIPNHSDIEYCLFNFLFNKYLANSLNLSQTHYLTNSLNRSTCGEATSSCSVDVSDQLLCLGLGTCSISPTSLDIKECHDVVGLVRFWYFSILFCRFFRHLKISFWTDECYNIFPCYNMFGNN